MADIMKEIDTLVSVVATDAGYIKVFKQDLPKVSIANSIAVRWQGDSEMPSTERFSRFRRTYQVIYFGSSQVDCLRNATKIQKILSPIRKLKIQEEEGYLNFEQLGFSAPFKTETDGVYAVIGIQPVYLYAQQERDKGPLIEQFEADIIPNLEEI